MENDFEASQHGSFVDNEIDGSNLNVLQFLDSLDSYLSLFDSLSSSLRQGWIELASARHSMGSLRITSVLLDLKPHDAFTTLHVDQLDGEAPSETVAPFDMVNQPHFTLSKWATINDGNRYSGELEIDRELPKNSSGSQLRRRGPSQVSEIKEKKSATEETSCTIENEIKNQRSKSLSVFGALVSPKLRDAQVSFETVLEKLVKLANTRSLLLSAFAQIHREMEEKEE